MAGYLYLLTPKEVLFSSLSICFRILQHGKKSRMNFDDIFFLVWWDV